MNEEEVVLAIKSKFDGAGMDAATGAMGKLNGLSANMGKGIAAGAVAGGVAMAALGAGALKVGQDFDGAFDSLRVATGKTGPELDKLSESMKNVVGNVPNEMSEVADVMGEISSRTGLTGKDLEKLTEQTLTLARVTGGDAKSSVENLTRMLGDASVPAGEMSGALDSVFKASQATGVGVDKLGGLMTAFGAPMRNLGFTMEESAALLGKFEKEGVNTELVMGALKKASAGWAKEGLAPIDGLTQTIAKIQELGPSAEATALSMETFGLKAGGDMVDTILGGKFAIDDLMKSIGESPETIMGAAAATDDFGEKWATTKNKILLALEPVGEAAMNAANGVMDSLAPAIEDLGPKIADLLVKAQPFIDQFIANLPGLIETLIPKLMSFGETIGTVIGFFADHPAILGFAAAFAGIIAAIAPLAAILGPVIGLFTTLMPIIAGIGAVLSGPVVLAVLAVVGVFALWKLKGDEIMAAMIAVGDAIMAKWEELKAAVAALGAGISLAWDNLKAATIAKWEEIRASIAAAWQAAVGFVLGKLAEMKDAIRLQWDAMLRNIQDKLDAILTGVTDAWNNVKAAIDASMQAVRDLINAAWEAIRDAIHNTLRAIQDTVYDALGAIERATGVNLGAIKELWDNAMYAIHDAVDAVISFLKGDWAAALDAMKSAVKTAVDAVVGFFRDLGPKVLDNLKALKDRMIEFGGDVVEGLRKGIADGWENLKRFLTNAIGDLISLAKRILGIASPSKVFIEIGEAIGKGIAVGVKRSHDGVNDAMIVLVKRIVDTVKTSESKFVSAGMIVGLKFANGIGIGFQLGKSVIATLLHNTIDAVMVDASKRIADNIRTFSANVIGEEGEGGRAGGLGDFGGKSAHARNQAARMRVKGARGASDEDYWANNSYGDSRHSHSARLEYLKSQGRQFYDPPPGALEAPSGGRASRSGAPVSVHIGGLKLTDTKIQLSVSGREITTEIVKEIIGNVQILDRLMAAQTQRAASRP